jgi:Response regulator
VKLSIGREIVYLHLATIRKRIGVHNSIGMIHALYYDESQSFDTLKLTPRGREVFRLILIGVTEKEIAAHLGISYSGVRRHKEKMLLMNDCTTMLKLISKYYEGNPDIQLAGKLSGE